MSREMFRVKDGRKIGWHWANNEIIDHFAKRIGMQGYAIYMYLSRFAGNDSGKCCKTQTDIADTFGVSRDTISRHIAVLIEAGLISVSQELGSPNTYTLLDSGEDLPQNQTPPPLIPAAKSDTPLPQNQTGVLQNQTPNKEERLLKDLNKENPLPPLENQEPSAEDQSLIEIDLYSAARTLGELIGLGHSGGRNLHRLTGAIEQAERRWKDKRRLDVVQDLSALWKEYCAQGLHAPVAIHNWIESVGSYIDSDHWKKKKKTEFVAKTDWQGGHVAEDGVYVNRHGKRMPGFICPPKPREAGD